MTAPLRRNIALSSEVLYQEIEGEILIVNVAMERYFALDKVAARFWQLIVETGDLEAIFGQMLDEYEIDEATLRRDLDTLTRQLAGKGLVVLTEPTAAI